MADWEELKNKKLTKAQTLKAAIMYIQHMEELLGGVERLNNKNNVCSTSNNYNIFDCEEEDDENQLLLNNNINLTTTNLPLKQQNKNCQNLIKKDQKSINLTTTTNYFVEQQQQQIFNQQQQFYNANLYSNQFPTSAEHYY